VDAVLLDNVLAERRRRTLAGFTVQPQPVAIGHYVGELGARNTAMRDRINAILLDGMRSGDLERIFRKWNVWNDDQPKLYSRLVAGESIAPVVVLDNISTSSAASVSRWEAARSYFPSLLRASVVTIVLSCLSMGLAVATGVLIATGRVYGARPLRVLLTGYV